MVFPKRDALVQDSERPITPLSHYIEDYYLTRSIWNHDSTFGVRGHYHVFTLGSMLELIQWGNQNLGLGWQIEAVEETDSKVGNGHTVVCRYLATGDKERYAERRGFAFNPPVARTPKRIFMRMRVEQLAHTSRQMIRDEGLGAFLKQTIRWLGGERRFFKR